MWVAGQGPKGPPLSPSGVGQQWPACTAAHCPRRPQELFDGLRGILKPDGILLGNMFGENTLTELNACFAQAEQQLDGGVSPHVSPMVGGGDVSSLLLNAGFAMPTVDVERKVRDGSGTVARAGAEGEGDGDREAGLPLTRVLLSHTLDAAHSY